MSPMRPVRFCVRAAISAPSPWWSSRLAEELGVQHLVVDAQHGAAAQHQVAAAAHALAVQRRGLVEGRGLGGAPVDHQAGELVVGHADAADVARCARLFAGAVHVVVKVKAAEDQAVLHGVQLCQPVLVEGSEGVAFGHVLQGALRPGGPGAGQLFLLFGAQLIEPAVELRNVVALSF